MSYGSEEVRLGAGTPQGSCLSPILFCIFVNSITEIFDAEKLTPSQYSDDVGIWSTASDVATAAKNIGEGVKKHEEWCRRWHVTLRPIKSQDTNEGRSRSRRPVYRYCPAGLLRLVGLRDSRLG